MNAEISVSFDEAAFGCEKVISLAGIDNGSSSGNTLKVKIPAGIDDGKSIRLRGKGMPGTGGGEAGDLMIKVNVGSRTGFERKGMDVYTTAMIPFSTADAVRQGHVQHKTGYTVRYEDPSERQRYRIDEGQKS